MTQPIHTKQTLEPVKLNQIKKIAAELGVIPTGNKTEREVWIDAIITHQASQVEKIADIQATAQAELERYVEQQAKTVALEEIKTVEISFGDHEVYAANELIASITIDDDLTQPWVVMVNHVEVFRDSTYKRCHSFIIWHYKQGSLPKPEQQASTDTAETACTTGNEVMAQIANECEKFELDLMDDGIYCNDVKLGEVGCSDGSWWVVRASSEHKNRVPCDSVAEAVWSLRMVEVLASGDVDQERTSCESLLDKPVDEVTISEWERLKKYYASLNETSELVAA